MPETCNPDEYSQVGSVMGLDRFVDAFESANRKRHLARKLLEDVPEMLEIAADEELRLFRRDVESRLRRLDRIWNFLHVPARGS